MTSHIAAARAVTAVFFQGLLTVGFWITTGILALLLVITALLAFQLSSWWWLLLAVILPVYGVLMGIGIGLYTLANRVLPRKLLSDERETIKRFTGHIQGLLETAKTPYPLIVFLIAKDVIRGRRSQFLDEHILSSQSLKIDYQQIKNLF